MLPTRNFRIFIRGIIIIHPDHRLISQMYCNTNYCAEQLVVACVVWIKNAQFHVICQQYVNYMPALEWKEATGKRERERRERKCTASWEKQSKQETRSFWRFSVYNRNNRPRKDPEREHKKKEERSVNRGGERGRKREEDNEIVNAVVAS